MTCGQVTGAGVFQVILGVIVILAMLAMLGLMFTVLFAAARETWRDLR